MRFGFLTGQGEITRPGPITTLAQHLEDAGFDSIMVPDHIIVPSKYLSQYPYTTSREFKGGPYIQEQMTTLAYIAAKTERIQLVPFVNVLPYRPALLTAKMLATIDVLSNGRAAVCVGAGWWEEEFSALGLSHYKERGNVTDEYVRAFKEVWTSDHPHFEGKYVNFSDISFSPKCVQKPHLPIWVGGESPHAIRRAGELADGWFPVGESQVLPLKSFEEIAAAKDRLEKHRAKSTSDFPYYEFGYRVPRGILDKEPSEVIQYIHNLEKLGVTHIGCMMQQHNRDLDEALKWIDKFAKNIIPEFKGSGT